MVTAWQIPLDPTKDASLTDTRMAEQVRWGYRIFTDTPREAARFTGGKVACSNCHLNAGQRERALALVGVAGMFPEYNNRAARLISLPDRIVDCFLRSENGTARPEELPTTSSKEVLAVASYITWLAKGYAVGHNPAWRNKNTIAADALIPIDKLDRALEAWAGNHESEIYEGAYHGWTVPDSPVYNEPQAERAFVKLKELFANAL